MRVIILLVFILLAGCTGSVTPSQNQAAQQAINAQSAACAQGQCPCQTPVGPVASGGKIPIYDVAQVACGNSCSTHATQITCTNGVFDHDITSAIFNCSPANCSNCTLGTNLINDGDSIITFSTAQVDCGDSCANHQTSRVCSNGQLSGDTSYNQPNCQPSLCECQMPDNSGFLTLGGSLTFYTTKTPACGQTCASVSQSRTCTSTGTGSSRTFAWSGSASYLYSTCTDPSAATCTCPLPDGTSLNNGQTIRLSNTAIATCTPCSALPGQSVTCTNGQLVDATTHAAASPASQGYTLRCVDKGCSCQSGWGEFVPLGTTITAYKQNTFAPGPCGVSCASEQETCQAGGVLTGTPSTYNLQNCASTCAQEGGGAPPRTCLLPWQNSFVTPGSKIPMWSKKTVACGSSCQNYFKVGTCQIATGTFDVGFSYIYPTCTELCP